MKDGHPAEAFAQARDALVRFPDDLCLHYLAALALSRGGNIGEAARHLKIVLDRIEPSTSKAGIPKGAAPEIPRDLPIDALSLAGKLRKMEYARAKNNDDRRARAEAAAGAYLGAYKSTRDFFPLINAATMMAVAGHPGTSRRHAKSAIELIERALKKRGQQGDYWLHASLGEAKALCGQSSAVAHYQKAAALAGPVPGDIGSMRQNLLLLKSCPSQVPPALRDECLAALACGTVVVCSGHMIDAPDRPQRGLPPRFPPDLDLERQVGQAIRDRLDALDAKIGFVSGANGTDLLFAEQLLDRGGELHLVLPFAMEDFYRTSVDFGLPAFHGWRERFDRVVQAAKQVHYATTESYLDDDILFEFANQIMQGLAIQRAYELAAPVSALLVNDQSAAGRRGGTSSFLAAWKALGNTSDIVDLGALRSPSGDFVRSRPAPSRSPAKAAPARFRRPRAIKAMLFADVKNFSKLSEQQARPFFDQFLPAVEGVITGGATRPYFRNTWGDGLFLAFDQVVPCADFTLRLLEKIESINWAKVGLPEDTTLRIGLHAGPVYPSRNPVVKRRDLFGSHVNRAARIEPVTVPGCAFASEQFAALLAAEPGHGFVCEYVGIETLAKGYDRVALYRLTRA